MTRLVVKWQKKSRTSTRTQKVEEGEKEEVEKKEKE
jgi:hypothetical protein